MKQAEQSCIRYASEYFTGLGRGIVMASDRGVCRVILPSPQKLPTAVAKPYMQSSSALTDHVAGLLASYFRGERQLFADISVDLSALTPFRASVLSLIRSIPYGEVKSYGEVAAMAGVPCAARAVGGAMASNPVPVIIPCHRVVASDGKLTGFTAPGGLAMKRYLLELECVVIQGKFFI